MKKNKKKTISMALALLMMLSIVPANIFAEGENVQGKDDKPVVEKPLESRKEQQTLLGAENTEKDSQTEEKYTVTINPKEATVTKGGSQKFTATVEKKVTSGETTETSTITNPEITWTVSTGVEGTSIDKNGKLTVAKAETATTLTVTASYKPIGNETAVTTTSTVTVKERTNKLTLEGCTAKVEEGTVENGNVEVGKTVNVTPNKAEEGKIFEKFEVKGITEYTSNTENDSISFTMPDKAVTVKAIYKDVTPPVTKHKLTLVDCTAKVDGKSVTSGSNIEKGKEVVLSHGTQEGKTFEKYESSEVTITNGKFTMPDKAVTVKAVFEDNKEEYKLEFSDRDDIRNLWIDGSSKSVKSTHWIKKGTKVEVEAYKYNDNNSSKDKFYRWNGTSGLDFYSGYDRYDKTIKFDMPSKNVKLSVDYDDDYWWDEYDLERIYPTNKERKDNGKRVEGKTKYKNEKIYVYLDGKEIGSGWTDSDGWYDIKLDEKVTSSEFKDLKYYVDEDAERDLKRVYPKDVELYNKSNGEYRKVEGKLKSYKNEKIYVYLNGKEIGYGWTDSDGEFDFKLDDYVDDKYDEDDLKFYVKDDVDSGESRMPIITSAMAGNKTIKGKDAGSKAELKVKDKNGYQLGTATADSDGEFTINLNRALKAGEIITITSKESGKHEYSLDYIVPGGYLDKPDANYGNDKGYIKGFKDGSFRPNGKLTRAQAATMVARLKNGSNEFTTSKITKFFDARNKWYSQAVNYAIQNGLVSGYPDGTFKPDEDITRAEFAQIITKDLNVVSKTTGFNDIDKHWAKTAIEKAYAAGIINGYPDGTFRPDAKITRAEATKMLNKAYNIKQDGTANKFWDVKSGAWYYQDVMKAANC